MNAKGLISELSNCIYQCGHCAERCLSEDNTGALRQCILTDLDCADYCSFLIRSLSRKSPLAKELVEKCIQICDACEKECSKHEHDHCRECADACRECMKVCKKYLKDLQDQ